MTLVLTTNLVGQTRGEPVRLPNRRRRLSTVVSRHRPPAGRRFIVSVHRRCEPGEAYLPSDRTVRLRADWARTLVGPSDVVVITAVPLGKNALSIGLAIASIALIALAPYAAPAIAGAAVFGAGVGATAGTLATAIQVGMVVGGAALGYAAQASKAAGGKKTGPESYSITGGGNVPKPNARKPLLYGRCWSAPPLSQQDYFAIDGDANVLKKRMTLGLGRFQVHNIRVGDALFWNETTGIQAPFNAQTGPEGAAIEILFEQASAIMPGDVIPSPSVGGQEIPRPGGNPARTPWYRLAPQGVSVDAAQFNWTYPAIYRISSSGKNNGTAAGVVFFGREIDPNTGTVIGPEFEMWRSREPDNAYIRSPLRRNAYFRLPKTGAYEVSAQNAFPGPLPGVEVENRVIWDAMFAFEDDTRIRPQTTEIVLRMRAGKGLTVTAYSDVMVEATRILPVWNGTAWVDQPTRKAVWAYCDLVRSGYGLALATGVDADKARYYADLLAENDTFDGQLPEVSSFWEAASELLLPLRADPVKVGPVHSFVRDESRDEPRHVLTRRQIVRDSGGATFRTKVEGGDVIVEFDRNGDPKRPDEVRYSYGPPSRTPKRYKVNGITDGQHALKHATWLAAVAVFRGAERRITTEWDGRLVFPGDHVLSDLWFLRGKRVYGVASRAGNVLQLDVAANVPTAYGHGSIRTRAGREWGILRMRGVGARGLELHPDDLAALEGRTGLTLARVLAGDAQDPTTVVLGDLVELQQTYVARSAIPVDTDHVQIEMVCDDARVWQLLDEVVIAPAPVGTDTLVEPLVPQISVLHARCARIETGIEVVWGVSATRGARNYEADLSYDAGATWEVLSQFGPASSGRAPVRQSDAPVTVRALAYGRTGLPGDYVRTTFTTVAPVVSGSLVDVVTLPAINYDGLAEDVRTRIETAQETAEKGVETAERGVALAGDALDAAGAALDKAVQGVDLAGEALGAAGAALDKAIEGVEDAATAQRAADLAHGAADKAQIGADAAADLAGDALNAAGGALDKALESLGNDAANAAGIIAETNVRVTQDTATATRIDGVVAKTESNAAAVLTEQTTRTTADGALAQRIDTVVARTETGIAAVTSEQTARVTADGVLASRIDTVSARTETGIAAVTSEQTARVAADGAAAQRIDSVVARTDDAIAGVTSEQTARSSADGALGQRIDSVVARTETGIAAVTSEQTARVAADGALGQRLDTVSARVDTTAASVTSEQTARVAADGAAAQRIDAVVARTEQGIAGVTSEQTARVSADGALGLRIDTVTAKTETGLAAVSSEQTARVSADGALGQRIDSVVAKTDGNAAGVISEQTARTSADGALGQRIDTVVARAETGIAAVTSEQTARATADGALAQRIDSVSARTESGLAAVTSEQTARAAADGALGLRIDTVVAKTDTGIAAVSSEQTARVTADGALGQRIDTVVAKSDGNAAAVTSEQTARVSADGALGLRIDTVTARAETGIAGVASEQTARVSADGALASRIDTISARTEAGISAVTSEQAARVGADGALGQRIDTVVARTETAIAGVTSEQTARATADGAIAQRIDTVTARTDNALAGITSEQTARTAADNALAQRIDAVVARTEAAIAGVSSEQSARVSAVSAVASRVDTVQAQTDKGTASGRMTLQARSDVNGVSARFETLLATTVGGQTRGAGYYIDLMPDGKSRFVIDANSFFITANGSTAPTFSFDGQTLTIPSLRVTNSAILPGAVSDTVSNAISDFDCAFTNEWKEVPGTGFTVTPDVVWTLLFSGTAILHAEASGNANNVYTTRLTVAVGLDGQPYSAFAGTAATAGGGGPNFASSDTPIISGPALFELLVAGQTRRIALIYTLTGSNGGGKIKFGQLKASVTKR